MKITVTTDLVAEPVSLTEAKANMKIVDFTTDDTLITSLIKSSRLHLEKFTSLSFGTKNIVAILENDRYEFEIPYGPIQSVTSVEKWDGDEWVTLKADTDYYVVGDDLKVFTYSKFRITYVAGYTSLPEDLKTDIKTLTAWQYQNRGIQINDANSDFPNYLNAWKYRKVVI
jgi:uncharacterized phiE125 gp8 family phage protein